MLPACANGWRTSSSTAKAIRPLWSMRDITTTALPKKWAGLGLIRSRCTISLSPIRTPTMWVRWKQTVRGCSGMRSCTSARSRTGISPARCGEKSSIISINCRRSRSTTKRYCCTMDRYLTLTASGSSVFWFPVIHGDIWSTSLTISTFLSATRCGLARTAATVLFLRWQRITSWQ